MSKKFKDIIINISYSLISNLIAFAVSTLVILVIPKFIGLEEYGYWQLYLFYISYVGFLHFGWNDGIYLRYGGEEYDNLDKNLLYSQYISLFIFQTLIGILLFLLSNIFVVDQSKIFILKMISISLIVINVRSLLLYVLQATNRIKEYARVTVIDRLIYIVLILLLLIFNIRNYKLMIIADMTGRIISFIYALYLCKEIVNKRITSYVINIQEILININIGIKLMFSNIASNLIIGIVRFGIERTWDVTTFGKVSLILSISNMMLFFINAVGLILFPLLRRTPENKLSNIYLTTRNILNTFLLSILIFYFPLKILMIKWLPQYADSLTYMSLVFPIFIFEGRMALLINTYFKTLRLEKSMLKVNIFIMFLSMIMTYISTQNDNLYMSVLNIVILLSLRSIVAEYYLSNKLNIKITKDIIFETFIIIIFILTGWFINSFLCTFIYCLIYFFYLLIKRKDIIFSKNYILEQLNK